MHSREIYEFEAFRFDARTDLLTCGGQPVPLTRKAGEVLRVLLEHAPDVVSKEDLLKEAWTDVPSVSDNTLTFHIHSVRRALRDIAEGRCIQTLPRRGYRFVAPVTKRTSEPPEIDPRWPTGSAEDLNVESTATQAAAVHRSDSRPSPLAPGLSATALEMRSSSSSAKTSAQAARPSRLFRLRLLALAAISAIAVIGVWLAATRSAPLPRVVHVSQLTHDGKEKSGPLIAYGNSIVMWNGSEQVALSLNGAPPTMTFPGYRLLDISESRGEALVTMPHDIGAERALWAVSLDGTRRRRLGTISTDSAAWSPNGRQFAYTTDHAVFVADAEGASIREIATFSGIPDWPRWAADNRSVRVVVLSPAARTLIQALYDIDLDAAREPRMVLRDIDAASQCCGSWVPRTNDYIFESGHVMEPSSMWIARYGSRLIRQPLVKASRLFPPADDNFRWWSCAFPSSSGDGARIFVLCAHTRRLMRYDMERRQLVQDSLDLSGTHIEFSRDGQWLTYIAPDHTLWRARADGTNARQLTVFPWKVDSSAWSANGEEIAIRSWLPGRHGKIYVMPSSGGAPQPLVGADVEQGSPTFSPDQTRIAFGDVPEVFRHPTGRERIHILDRVTAKIEDVPGSAGLWSSRWSPDGRYLAANRITDGKLMLFDFLQKRWREFDIDHVGDAVWTRDSEYLYCFPDGAHGWVERLRVSDSTLERLFDLDEQPYARDAVGVTRAGEPMIAHSLIDLFAVDLDR